MGKKNKLGALSYVVISVLLGILSFAITIQVRSLNEDVVPTKSVDFIRAEELQQLLSAEQDKVAKLEALVEQYKADIDDVLERIDDPDGYVAYLSKQLETARILAGLEEVKGPGVVITMDDSSNNVVAEGINPNSFILHDSDVLAVLNELRDAGAEVLSINDERILASTEIRCAGNVVSINNKRTSVPFIIKAIGDPEKLSAGVNIRGGIVDQLTPFGVVVRVEKQSEVVIPAYSGVLGFDYAKPVDKGGDQ